MIADAERLDQSQGLGRESLSVVDALHRHRDVLGERALTLHAHSLVIGTGIHQSTLAGIAAATIKIGIAGDHHTGLQSLVIWPDLHDFRGKLVSRNTGVNHIGVRSPIGAQITAADSAVQQLKQRLPFTGNRLIHLGDDHLAWLWH